MVSPSIHSFLFFSVSVSVYIFFFSVLSIFCSNDFSFSTTGSGLIHQPARRIRPTRTRKCTVHLPSDAAIVHTSATLPSTFQTTKKTPKLFWTKNRLQSLHWSWLWQRTSDTKQEPWQPPAWWQHVSTRCDSRAISIELNDVTQNPLDIFRFSQRYRSCVAVILWLQAGSLFTWFLTFRNH